jgi:hypothetical protein
LFLGEVFEGKRGSKAGLPVSLRELTTSVRPPDSTKRHLIGPRRRLLDVSSILFTDVNGTRSDVPHAPLPWASAKAPTFTRLPDSVSTTHFTTFGADGTSTETNIHDGVPE